MERAQFGRLRCVGLNENERSQAELLAGSNLGLSVIILFFLSVCPEELSSHKSFII